MTEKSMVYSQWSMVATARNTGILSDGVRAKDPRISASAVERTLYAIDYGPSTMDY